MLELLSDEEDAPADSVLQLAQDFLADPRSGKVDLGVGVYKDARGHTPVLQAVKAAEGRIHMSQDSKSYLGLLGNAGFNTAISELILGVPSPKVPSACVQTPGGSSALRLIYDLIKLADSDATVWLPDQTWANHEPTLRRAGLRIGRYAYFNSTKQSVDFEQFHAFLTGLGAHDVVILHGCCHNPTGASLSPDQWDAVAMVLADSQAVPLVDIAYQGFGNGLEADAYGVRRLAGVVSEMFVAYSCSKNFAVYRERTGLAMYLSSDTVKTARALSYFKQLARTNHSMPPDHGAEIVRTILTDPELRRLWEEELETMRLRLLTMRETLSDALRAKINSDRFDFLRDQQGMFSLLGISKDQVAQLRSEAGIYMASSSRINVAGLTDANLETFVEAVSGVLAQ